MLDDVHVVDEVGISEGFHFWEGGGGVGLGDLECVGLFVFSVGGELEWLPFGAFVEQFFLYVFDCCWGVVQHFELCYDGFDECPLFHVYDA